MKKTIIAKYLFFSLVLLIGCRGTELDNLDPINSVPADGAIDNLRSATAAVAGMYHQLQMIFEEDEFAGDPHWDAYMGMAQLYSDEAKFTGTSPTRQEFSSLNVTTANRINESIFSVFYRIINTANNLVELLPLVDDPTLSESQLNSFLGEARFVRALCYFFLTNYYGEVPLVVTPTRSVGNILFVTKETQSNIYSQIIQDLIFAEANIKVTQKNRANQKTASGFLARVYLYQEDWGNALTQAEKVIGGDFDLGDFPYLQDELFYIGYSTGDGNELNFFYGPSELGGRHDLEPSEKFLNSFEQGDMRKDLIVDASLTKAKVPYVLKYDDFQAGVSGTGTDPVMLFRYAEQLLIAAEAAAEMDDFVKANQYYEQVRSRAGLGEKTLDGSNYLDLILQERLIELSFEGPHRWFDLRRRGKATSEIQNYQSCNDVWPIPVREIDRNPNLMQNSCCNC